MGGLGGGILAEFEEFFIWELKSCAATLECSEAYSIGSRGKWPAIHALHIFSN